MSYILRNFVLSKAPARLSEDNTGQFQTLMEECFVEPGGSNRLLCFPTAPEDEVEEIERRFAESPLDMGSLEVVAAPSSFGAHAAVRQIVAL